MCVARECDSENDASDGGSDSSRKKCGKTVLWFPDTVIAACGSLGDLIGDKTTSQCTTCNTEKRSHGGGTSLTETHKVRWLREEDRFLNIRSDDPGEEVAIDEDSP